ncbi:predicted protein [Sclerotinia sclerotiorum 1980 UF-70]|uniref:Uncharacterized protein n=1 Tax=Sclerotinia sclerotiorum (strain ATCC 18683 / 1980 / Ss-1) TaxID=665079 RepID=A7EQ22_SCLS1|nr:predicted protein [Sclerotinia sclerotiorum 1980 UF-70]EDO04938.1 predicted protein [Sclerotinia sclerotiorum 1980 UF-70]
MSDKSRGKGVHRADFRRVADKVKPGEYVLLGKLKLLGVQDELFIRGEKVGQMVQNPSVTRPKQKDIVEISHA